MSTCDPIDLNIENKIIDVGANISQIESSVSNNNIDVGVVSNTIDASATNTIVEAQATNPVIDVNGFQIININLGSNPVTAATFPAGATMTAYTAVSVVAGWLQPVSIFDTSQQFAPVGILLADVSMGFSGTIALSGLITNAAWSWDLDKHLFVGDSGALVQTPLATADWLINVGRAASATQLVLDVQATINIDI